MADADFVRNSILEVLIPQDQDLDIEETLRTAAEDESDGDTSPSLWSSIPQRDLLFFGESVFAPRVAKPAS